MLSWWRWITWFLSVALIGAAPVSQPEPSAGESYRAVLDEYCVTCHSDIQQKLGRVPVSLQTTDVAHPSADAAVWEKVLRKLRAGSMPPPDRPRPEQATYDSFVSYLETSIDQAAETRVNPGRTESLHRLTRVEYGNVIRDLLGLEIDVASLLPADAADRHGFDNMAGELRVSPALLDRYLSAAHKVSRLTVGLSPMGSTVDTYSVPILLLQEDQLNPDLPFGSRGGIAVRHNFPVDGEYEFRIRLQTNYVGYVRGMYAPHTVEVRLDGRKLREFTVGGGADGAPAPMGFEGNVFGSPEWEHYTQRADEGLVVRVPVRAGPRLVTATFPREAWARDGVLQRPVTGYPRSNNALQDHNPSLGSLEIAGPYAVTGPGDTPSRRNILVCEPASVVDEERCAMQILSRLARLAYRRPVTDADREVLWDFFQQGRAEGNFDAGIQAGLERILSAPDFLFRIERDPIDVPSNTAYRVRDLELASRLSFLLWSSMPDEELLDLASRGQLETPAVLVRQIRRMLADPRSKALVHNFFGQWLSLRQVATVYPDPVAYPSWDDSLREAFQRETELFIDYQLRDDRRVTELLSANYSFLNERLAEHYGIPQVYGSRFRRVTFRSTQRRGGLLGHGSILVVTSYPTRTSPVLRGKFLLENILGTPPPPPPPNVPPLPSRDESGEPASVRELLEVHRRNPVCASCHAQMDPLGFGLENFDGIGTWRTASEAGTPLDTSGQFSNGDEFEGLAGLRAVLLSRPEQFVRTVTEKLLSYALGREVEYYDMPAVRAITRDAASDGYSWSSVIVGIVQSAPFQMRTSAASNSVSEATIAAPR